MNEPISSSKSLGENVRCTRQSSDGPLGWVEYLGKMPREERLGFLDVLGWRARGVSNITWKVPGRYDHVLSSVVTLPVQTSSVRTVG